MRAAVIVAHPDDETIWCGGLLLRHRDWHWRVLSLCRAGDADRAPKFGAVCQRLGAEALMSDLDDSPELAEIDVGAEVGGRIARALGEADWDVCVTHGANGEYGHRRHVEVHREVAAMVGDGRLRTRELWTFAYECAAPTGANRPAEWADVLVALTAEELAEKRRLVSEVYGYARGGFEVTACISPEALKFVKHEEVVP